MILKFCHYLNIFVGICVSTCMYTIYAICVNTSVFTYKMCVRFAFCFFLIALTPRYTELHLFGFEWSHFGQ